MGLNKTQKKVLYYCQKYNIDELKDFDLLRLEYCNAAEIKYIYSFRENEDKFFQLTNFGLQQIELVEKNKQLALTFFTKILGVSFEQADTDSCKIEHLLSAETSEKLEKFLKK